MLLASERFMRGVHSLRKKKETGTLCAEQWLKCARPRWFWPGFYTQAARRTGRAISAMPVASSRMLAGSGT
jgi:hypothetical protein